MVSNLQAKKILQEVEWVITGQKTDAKAAKSKNAQATNQKKDRKGWGNNDYGV